MNFKFLLFTILLFNISFAQNKDNNLILWSSTNKLTINDFGIKLSNKNEVPSYGQYSIDYNLRGFDFLTKNFNKKVRNYFIKSASWIDTTSGIATSLKYQQTVFDLSEIYARHFRKELKDNRIKILKGFQFAQELSEKFTTDFSNRKLLYNKETNFGTIQNKQLDWEIQIQKELEEYKDYSYE
ncbi:hypothetical protein [Chryseobacterium nematophagum]|nr:hypothetical protein [Chryseobacterium nematophagum]